MEGGDIMGQEKIQVLQNLEILLGFGVSNHWCLDFSHSSYPLQSEDLGRNLPTALEFGRATQVTANSITGA